MLDRRAGANPPVRGAAPIVSLGPRELLDASPDVVFACDHDGVLLWLNRAFESLTGRPSADFIGRPALGLLPAAARPRALRTFLRQRRRRLPLVETTLPLVDGGGAERPARLRVRLLEHADGGVLYLGTAQPAPALPATAAAEPLATNELLATLSHASRTHMNGVMGMARLLLQTSLAEDQRDMVDVILGAGQSLLQTVGDAIEYAKLESGTLDLERIAFDLRVAARETAALLEAEAREKGLDFECHVHHEVPSLLWGDPGRLRQVVLQLGRNAIRFTSRGGVSLWIERRREDERTVTARFLVRDSGEGASGEHIEQLLRQTARHEAQGLAAGPSFDLLVVRRLVELMGGSLGTEREPEGGSRVWFELTLEMQTQQERGADEPPARAELAGQRALVVDSSAMMRRSFVARLETLGCRVSEAEQAGDALGRLREAARAGEPFRWALIERELTGGDGEELGAAIRADRALDGTLTLLLTSVGRRGDAARARERGFSAYLPTTIESEELAEALGAVIRNAAVPASGAPLVTRYSLVEARRARTRILVVEDSTVSQLVTQWALNRLGYQVQIVGAASAARSAWLGSAYDVAIVDGRLPDADSFALVGELRAQGGDARHTVFVAMVDEDTETVRARWQGAGVEELITKPVNLEAMTALVERVTRTSTAWGPEVEDDGGRGRAAGAGPGTEGGRVEVVMPDVDQLLSESDVQQAMAAAMHTALSRKPTPSAATPPEAPANSDPSPAPGGTPTPADLGTLTAADVEGLDPGRAAAAGALSSSVPPGLAEPDVGIVAGFERLAGEPLPAAPPASSQEADRTPTIDLEQLEQASMGIASLRDAMLGAFLGEVRPRLERLARAVSAGDAAAVRSEAHGLRVLSGTIGAKACAADFAALERRGEEERLEGAVVALRGAYVEVIRAEEQATKLRDERLAA